MICLAIINGFIAVMFCTAVSLGLFTGFSGFCRKYARGRSDLAVTCMFHKRKLLDAISVYFYWMHFSFLRDTRSDLEVTRYKSRKPHSYGENLLTCANLHMSRFAHVSKSKFAMRSDESYVPWANTWNIIWNKETDCFRLVNFRRNWVCPYYLSI